MGRRMRIKGNHGHRAGDRHAGDGAVYRPRDPVLWGRRRRPRLVEAVQRRGVRVSVAADDPLVAATGCRTTCAARPTTLSNCRTSAPSIARNHHPREELRARVEPGRRGVSAPPPDTAGSSAGPPPRRRSRRWAQAQMAQAQDGAAGAATVRSVRAWRRFARASGRRTRLVSTRRSSPFGEAAAELVTGLAGAGAARRQPHRAAVHRRLCRDPALREPAQIRLGRGPLRRAAG